MTRERNKLCSLRQMLLLAALLLLVGGCSPADSTAPPTGHDAATTVAVDDSRSSPERETPDAATVSDATTGTASGLPRLLDLGAGKCIPCKMMAPILEELQQEYSGVCDVEFIDVWQHPEEAKKYGVETIPTQIFFDASGTEVFRHVGFFSKEEILAKWKDLGVELKESKEPNDV